MVEGDKTTSDNAAALAVARLAELTTALGSSFDEQRILSATMSYLGPFAPVGAKLFYLHMNPQGAPRASQPVAQWHRDGAAAQRIYEARHPLADSSLLKRCLDHGAEPMLLDSLDERQLSSMVPPLCDDPAVCRALALLPLRSDSNGGWQGILSLFWNGPHEYSPYERSTYKLVMAVLASHIGGQRSQQELAEALAESALLQKVTEQLNVAVNLDQTLQALLLPAPATEEATVSLCSIENSDLGTPEWLTMLSMVNAAGESVPSQLGKRYYLPNIPFAKLYLDSPDVPVLVSDVENDPRVDEHARNLYRVMSIRSTILIALTLQGRWVGLLSIAWPRQVVLTERVQRVYRALARQAALMVDNTVMFERVRASLKSSQEQGELLRSVLDNVPIGVLLIEAPSGKPLLGNHWLSRIMGAPLNKDLGGAPVIAEYKMVYPRTDRPLEPEDLPSRRVMRSAKTEVIELDFLRPEGERVSTETTAVPLFDDTGTVNRIIIIMSDLTARKRAERDKAEMQDEIIRVQAATLAERSSPLIPITDEILVLPLIGSIDTERGQQVLETVLHGTSERGARVAIIDITGVRTVDTQAASALTNAALALRLLGVEPVLTGIRPEVAQTLVGLGVNLNGITTRSTLQSGIKYALKHLGKPRLA